jgi:hypothetical protein
MAYPERKPIYETYEEIIKKIIDSKSHKTYAESEIDSLDRDLLAGFRAIRNKRLFEKWKATDFTK